MINIGLFIIIIIIIILFAGAEFVYAYITHRHKSGIEFFILFSERK